MFVIMLIITVAGFITLVGFAIAYRKCEEKNELKKRYYRKQIMSSAIITLASGGSCFVLLEPLEEGPVADYVNGLNQGMIALISIGIILIFINFIRYMRDFY